MIEIPELFCKQSIIILDLIFSITSGFLEFFTKSFHKTQGKGR